MTAFYDRLEATAQRLIGQYGFGADLVRAGTPTGPAHNPQPGAPTRHACKVVEVEYSLTKGQTIAPKMGYIPLPDSVIARVRKAAALIQ